MGRGFGDRVRVVPLSSIATDPLRTTNDILSWLEVERMPEGTSLPRYNERGEMNPSGWAKTLREPPSFLSKLARTLLPTKGLRRAILDPIRSPGFKPIAADSPVMDEQTRHELESAFAEEIEFQENLPHISTRQSLWVGIRTHSDQTQTRNGERRATGGQGR
ncbi:MAG: hypothetical protein Ct9H300mP30_4070 [Methanobacteriota archaeon]|nr:MAG: hypothetical protein Ct9H300mP30_4070 [Euryarchaeota archaeon]